MEVDDSDNMSEESDNDSDSMSEESDNDSDDSSLETYYDRLSAEGQLFLNLIRNQEWDEIKSRILTYRNHQHLEYVKENIASFLYHDTEDIPLEILQNLFDARRRLDTNIEYDNEDGEFLWEIVFDVCCVHRYSREEKLEELCRSGRPEKSSQLLYLCFERINFGNLRIETQEIILQEHDGRFCQMFNEKFDFERSKRLLVTEGMWGQMNLDDIKFDSADLFHSCNSVDDLREQDDFLFDVWKRTEMLLLYQKHNPSPLLHYAVKNGYPLNIILFISKLYPHQIYKDEFGNKNGRFIPLHYAFRDYRESCFPILGCRSDYEQIGLDSSFLFRTNGCKHGEFDLIEKLALPYYLIKRFPASVRLPDRFGRLPLHLFLDCIDGWIRKEVNGEVRKKCMEFLYWLIRIAPEALEAKHVTSNLLPFMMPSIQQPNEKRNDDNNVPSDEDSWDEAELGYDGDRSDRDLLTVTYHMLRENPTVLKSFIDTEKSLESYRTRSLRKDVESLQSKLSVADETILKQQNEIANLKEELERLKLESSSTTVATTTFDKTK